MGHAQTAFASRWLTLALSAGLLAALVFASIQAAGAFVYALDDPYIHLALARNIQQGSYGINPGEWASPSSSILWPFLLALAPTRWIEWAPLAINATSCLLSVLILRDMLRHTALPFWGQTLGAIAVGFGLNLFGLPMTGMEHSLQVLLVMFLAARMVAQRYDTTFYVALVVAPLVRYETLAISAACAGYLFFTLGVPRERLRPLLAMGVVLALMALFSLMLHLHGMGWLPSSVMAKMTERSLYANLRLQPMVLPLVVWLGWAHASQGWYLRYFLLVLAPTLAFLLFGSVSAFGRYEAFMAAWLVIFTLRTPVSFRGRWWHWARVFEQRPVILPALMCVAFSVCFTRLWGSTYYVPGGSANIAEQQAVMAEVARQLGEPVAVNDLGLVALRSGVYVLDLWGLASHDALQARLNGIWVGATIEALMADKGVEYAFVYKHWFPHLPNYYYDVASLVLESPQVSVAGPSVAFVARNKAAARRLHAVLTQMTKADPRLNAKLRVQPFVALPFRH